jgi:transcription initiation factor TFIIIB Brf1 subunit/transcription initiation factor TFIIB
MTDFDLLFQLNEEYEHSTSPVVECCASDCQHTNTTIEKTMEICMDCGKELMKNEMKCSLDTVYSNMNERKTHVKNINKDIANFNFSEKIVECANTLYNQITDGKTKRGDRRKSIILACIFFSHKMNNENITYERLLELFQIDKKIGNDGLNIVTLSIPKNINMSFNSQPQCLIIIDELMNKFSATTTQKNEVKAIYYKIKNKSASLNRCRVETVGASIFYYWIKNHSNINISIKNYSEVVKLSELTIQKNLKIIEDIMSSVNEKR